MATLSINGSVPSWLKYVIVSYWPFLNLWTCYHFSHGGSGSRLSSTRQYSRLTVRDTINVRNISFLYAMLDGRLKLLCAAIWFPESAPYVCIGEALCHAVSTPCGVVLGHHCCGGTCRRMQRVNVYFMFEFPSIIS